MTKATIEQVPGGYLAHTWNNRTGDHQCRLVSMPNGDYLAVWPEQDGPDALGYCACGPDGAIRSSSRQEYEEYGIARDKFWAGVADRMG